MIIWAIWAQIKVSFSLSSNAWPYWPFIIQINDKVCSVQCTIRPSEVPSLFYMEVMDNLKEARATPRTCKQSLVRSWKNLFLCQLLWMLCRTEIVFSLVWRTCTSSWTPGKKEVAQICRPLERAAVMWSVLWVLGPHMAVAFLEGICWGGSASPATYPPHIPGWAPARRS